MPDALYGPDGTPYRTSKWDEEVDFGGASHPNLVDFFSGVTDTNATSAVRDVTGSVRYRKVVDLTGAKEFRFCVNMQGNPTAAYKINVQFSTDRGSNWTTLVTLGATVGIRESPWAPMPPAAAGDVMLRLAPEGGDGAADPIIGQAFMQLR